MYSYEQEEPLDLEFVFWTGFLTTKKKETSGFCALIAVPL